MTWRHSVPYVPPVVAIDGYPNHDWYGDWSYVVVVAACMSLWISRRGSDVDEGVPWPYGAINNSSDLGGRGWIECVCQLLLWSVLTTLLVAVRHGSLSLPVIYLSLSLSMLLSVQCLYQIWEYCMLPYRSFNIYYNCDIEYDTVYTRSSVLLCSGCSFFWCEASNHAVACCNSDILQVVEAVASEKWVVPVNRTVPASSSFLVLTFDISNIPHHRRHLHFGTCILCIVFYLYWYVRYISIYIYMTLNERARHTREKG